VETVQEGGSDDGGEWPEINLSPRQSNAYNDPDSTYDSGLQELVIDTNNPGHANFALNVGALGKASGTLMDGAQDMSFGKSTFNKGYTVDGDEGNEGATSNYIHQDPSDPEVMAALLTQPPVADPRSPTTTRVDEQVMVTNYSPDHSPSALQTLGAAVSTSTENLGGASTTGQTQGGSTLSQGNPLSTQPGGNAITNGDLNSNNSGRNGGNQGNQGGSNANNGPQGPDPSGDYVDKLVFAYQTLGGPLETWGIQGTVQVADVVQFTPAATPQSPNRLALNSVRRLAWPDIVDRVMDHVYFNNLHNDKPRVQAIINGMDVFVLTAPNTRITSDNLTMLEDDVQSSEELCDMLIGHLLYVETLPPD